MPTVFSGESVELLLRLTPADNAKARELFEKAIALDPNYAPAYAQLALTHFSPIQVFPPGKPQESYQKALDLASKALALDPSLGDGHAVLGQPSLYSSKPEQALAQYQEGLKANPNDADLLTFSPKPTYGRAKPEEAIQRIKEAMRLNPYYPNWYLWFWAGGQFYAAHDYEGASRHSGRCLPWVKQADSGRFPRLPGTDGGGPSRGGEVLKDNPHFSASYWGSTSRSSTKRIDSTRWRATSRLAFRGEIPWPDEEMGKCS